MTIERPMLPPRREAPTTIETIEPYAIPDAFCEAQVRVEHLGPCRRLVFAVTDHSEPERPQRVVCAKLILPAEVCHAIAAALFRDSVADDAVIAARHLAVLN